MLTERRAGARRAPDLTPPAPARSWLTSFRSAARRPLLLLLLAQLGLLLAHQFPARYLLELNRPENAPLLVNFYEIEPDPAGGHRWSRPQAEVFLPAIDAAPTIRLLINNTVPANSPPRRLDYRLAGQTTRSVPLADGPASYELAGEAARGFWPAAYATRDREGFIETLWLSGPVLQFETQPVEVRGDRRQLGLVLGAVEVRAGLTTGRVGLPTFVNMLLTAVIALGACLLLGTLRRGSRTVWPGTLAALAPWLALVAFGRAALADNIELAVTLVLLALLGLTAARFAGPLALADGRQLAALLRQKTAGAGSQKPAPTAAAGPRPVYLIMVGVAWLAYAAHLAGYFLPAPVSPYDTRSFGLRYLAAWPWPLVLILTGLAGLATLPATNRWLAGRFQRLAAWRPLAGRSLTYKLAVAGLAVLAVAAVCLLLRTRVDYGDYEQIIYKLERLKRLDALPGPENFLIWREGEILDYALHFLLWRVFENSGWWQPSYTYTLTSALAGGIFVVVAWLLAWSLTAERAGRLLIFGLQLTAGGTLVFFGYVESYTLVTLAAMVYALAAVWAFAPPVGRPLSIVWPALALGLAILLHPLAVFLGPSYLAGLMWRAGLARRFRPGRLAVEICQSLVLGGLLLGGLVLLMGFYNYTWAQWDVGQHYVGGSDRSLFKPLLEARPDTAELYPILSLDFARFQFNLQMLVAPVSLLGLAGLLLERVGRRVSWPGLALLLGGLALFVAGLTLTPGRYNLALAALGLAVQVGGLWRMRRGLDDPAGLFLGVAALYTWLFSIVWNPDLGSNDWDLLSLNGFFTSLALGYWLTRRLEHAPLWLARVAVALLAVSGSLWLAWIGYNAFFA